MSKKIDLIFKDYTIRVVQTDDKEEDNNAK